jgi:hypothetical protein
MEITVHSSPNFGATFSVISFALILAKNEFGYILGDFFTNSSGHPGRDRQMCRDPCRKKE